MISNVNSLNNKFYFDDDKEIPEGSYEIHDINKYLRCNSNENCERKNASQRG